MSPTKIIRLDDEGYISLEGFVEPNATYKVTKSPEGVIYLEPIVTITKEEYEFLKGNQK